MRPFRDLPRRHLAAYVPHYYLSTTVDLGRALDWLHERNRALDVSHRLVPAALMRNRRPGAR